VEPTRLIWFNFPNFAANARLGSNKTSTITIQDDDSPHGILSFATHSITVLENVSVVDVIVSRTGGTFGDVGVLVRTIGGGESWTSGAREDISVLLSTRERSSIAVIGDDYYALSSRLTFSVSLFGKGFGRRGGGGGGGGARHFCAS
jgi:hypothetical protein